MSETPQPRLTVSPHGVRVLACPVCGAAHRSVEAYDDHFQAKHSDPEPIRNSSTGSES